MNIESVTLIWEFELSKLISSTRVGKRIRELSSVAGRS